MSVSVTSKQIAAALEKSAAQSAADPSMQQLGDKFKSLMQQPRMEAPSHGQNDGTNVVSKLVASQDAELQRSVNDVVSLSDHAEGMSMQEMTAATMKVTLELASTQLDMEAKMSVVDSSKSSLETLMKNQ
ncbi:type III secretion protein HrpB2 [Paraburkholderia agricolaris]|jgi:type III secretion inner rod protein HrpB2|uniref:Type III secretion protein HrpB2 n=1 Tax=Paraburkholderia agricolaris TaxID=2152888 RepID=A0ABW8ZTG4_9BURK|nr:type III secretion protein HrpB2 [Paraburkholderia agricolaris]MDE1006343.1 type III secretion protein HrpB2 [Paraburkholderia fungorum]